MARSLRLVTVGGLVTGMLWLGAGSVAAGGGGHCDDPTAEGTGTSVEMIGACFTPTLLRADVGETITFTNRDPMEHNVAPAGWGWGHVDALRQGESFTAAFDEPGIYTYACSLHPGMTGAVVIEPQPSLGSATVAASSPGGLEPGVAIAIGVVGIVAGYTVGRRPRRSAQAQPYQPASGA